MNCELCKKESVVSRRTLKMQIENEWELDDYLGVENSGPRVTPTNSRYVRSTPAVFGALALAGKVRTAVELNVVKENEGICHGIIPFITKEEFDKIWNNK